MMNPVPVDCSNAIGAFTGLRSATEKVSSGSRRSWRLCWSGSAGSRAATTGAGQSEASQALADMAENNPEQVGGSIHEGLDDHPKVTIHDYPGEDHGFAAEMGNRRSEGAARLADSRTEAFFAEHLG